MANRHARENSSGTALAKEPLSRRFSPIPGPRAASTPALVSTAASGLNAWLVIAVWPLFFGDAVTPTAIAVTSAPLLLLAAGLWTARRNASPWLLLLAFPWVLFAASALHPATALHRALTPIPLLAAVLSITLYGACAAWATTRPAAPPRQGDSSPLGHPSSPSVRPANPVLRRLVIAIALSGALAIALVAPVVGGRAALERDWGEAAARGAVLTAVVAATVGSVVIAVFLGPALRADDRRPRRSRRARRTQVVVMLLLTLLGAAAYSVIR
jgi:hypothetical protein